VQLQYRAQYQPGIGVSVLFLNNHTVRQRLNGECRPQSFVLTEDKS
jgi:hypothetical protein